MLIPFIKAIDFPAKIIKNDGLPLTIHHFLYCFPNKKKDGFDSQRKRGE
jgi:hypothetical protein